MLQKDTDKTWEYYGKTDPYFGVLSSKQYKDVNLTLDARKKFFETGDHYINTVMKIIHDDLDAFFQPKRALDFGSGVGRIVIPLAKMCDSVTGVEISDSMIKEAVSNCRELGLTNVTFVKSDDSLSRVSGTFNFIHSFIVFQHIAQKRGVLILRKLVDLLQEQGIGVLHITYFSKDSFARKLLAEMYKYLPFLFGIRNIYRGRPFREPMMHMNEYDLNRVFRILQDAGCHRCQVRFTDHGTYGLLIMFQKKRIDAL